MCTNYTPGSRDFIRGQLAQLNLDDQLPEAWRPESWPGYQAPMLASDGVARLATFGLVPFFSKDGKDFRRTYNARSETVASKPSYRGPWKRGQFALIPMLAFFEPNYVSGKPVRWRINRVDQQPFTVAAIWDTWKPPDGEKQHSFSMLTVNADRHPVMQQFHKPGDEKRSIVVIPEDRREAWLAGDEPEAHLRLMEAEEFTSSEDPVRKATV